ncbi:MAG: hypothetical protein AB7T02_02500 [Mesotoga sp.]|nr:conserved hypothetical protein [Mesotoga infera]
MQGGRNTRSSSIAVLKQEEQPALFIRAWTNVQDLPTIIGRYYGEIAAYSG